MNTLVDRAAWLATRQQIKTLRRGFIRQVQQLGDRYLLARAQFIEKR